MDSFSMEKLSIVNLFYSKHIHVIIQFCRNDIKISFDFFFFFLLEFYRPRRSIEFAISIS